jgi:hypothetical protein
VLVLGERVRAACLEKIATFCGPEAVSQDVPALPRFQEPLLSNLPPPPTEPQQFAQWAQTLTELSEQQGEAKGRLEGEAKGRLEGEVKGEARGTAAAILLVLKTRGIAVPEEIEQRIAACSDPAVLSLWLTRAVTATSAADVVAPTS